MTDEVRVVAVLQARPGDGAQVLAAWPALAEQVRAEEGNLAYDLHRVVGDEDRFVVLERYTSVQALEAHRASPHMLAFGRSAGALFAGRPEVFVLEDAPAV